MRFFVRTMYNAILFISKSSSVTVVFSNFACREEYSTEILSDWNHCTKVAPT